jgi:ribosomal-protein-alanine N-acetyltransferase
MGSLADMIDSTWRPPVLETPRLRLRAFEGTDAEALFAIASNPNVTRYTLWDAHRSLDDSHAFLRDYAAANYMIGVPDPYAIVFKETESLVGAIGAHWASEKNKCLEFGYWLAEEHWGRGIAVEAGRALLTHVFASYDVERVQAHCMEENVTSARVLEKLGVPYEGTHRSALYHRGRFWDLRMYAVLRKNWTLDP